MWPSQRLMFFTTPEKKSTLKSWLMLWILLSVFLACAFSPTCMNTPLPNTSSIGTEPVCTPADNANTLEVYFILAVLLLIGILVFAVATRFAPRRFLALTVTAQGLISASSRFPDAVIGWANIESLALYQDATHPGPDDPLYYLVVTVYSPYGMHDSEVIERVWRQYPRVPDMDRVALMLRLERPTDASGKRITAADVVERIQICFPQAIAQNGIEVFENVRPV